MRFWKCAARWVGYGLAVRMFTDAEVAAATETTICEGEEASTCPTIARTYGDVTDHMFSLADARDLLPRPVKSAVYDQLLYATNRGLDGILAPLTPCTEGLADVIHPGKAVVE